ncbi:hypothetical protein [Teichococcus aestuarii]|uniref:hypothetical protein n=1 Tax=Teichococcus aestuarii TaxID=568898 RepID=UPI0036189029
MSRPRTPLRRSARDAAPQSFAHLSGAPVPETSAAVRSARIQSSWDRALARVSGRTPARKDPR